MATLLILSLLAIGLPLLYIALRQQFGGAR